MEKNPRTEELSIAIEEIENANKEVSRAFLFQKEKILVKDSRLTETDGNKVIKAFEEMSNRANVMDGIEAITIHGANGRVDITQVNGFYLATVASKDAKDQTINNLPHTLNRFLTNYQGEVPQQTQPVEIAAQAAVEQKEMISDKPTVMLEQKESFEPRLPFSEGSEFTVDNLGRLDVISASSGTVRLDIITIGRWTERYGENKIHKVTVTVPETGKSVECKFEKMKESNGDAKNLVLIPEIMQRNLKIGKGAKVMIKPQIEPEPTEKPLENQPNPQAEERKAKNRFLGDSPAYQLIAADLSGFSSLVGNDMVRFDEGLVEMWREFYGPRKIEEVIINDTLLGKSVQCKFKIVKDPKFEGKGLIQIPKSIRQKLAIKEGSLVTIKPVVN
jgi:hypothetical protein